MAKSFCTLFVFIVLWTLPLTSHAEGTIQSRIDKAPEHGIVKIPSGVYDETIVLSKPITLEGIGQVTIRSCNHERVITVKGQQVTLRNVRMEQCNDINGDTAIYVTGKNHHLEKLHIKTSKIGIKIDKTSHSVIKEIFIKGEKKGNGIDLWKSNSNIVENVRIEEVSDGIYLENSDFTYIIHNTIQHSRYGIHIMFSQNITVKKNVSRDNMAGAMVMETKGSKIEENDFLFNNRNVHALGILLYDAVETDVIRNKILNNRVGVYIEDATNNRIFNNEIRGNFIGMQFKNTKENTVSNNSFIANVNDIQAIASAENKIVKNYWDTSLKLDLNGDGMSYIPYRADPFYLTLTTDIPEYQLFFNAPGVVMLQKMMKSPDDEVLMDGAPLMFASMKEYDRHESSNILISVISISMLGGSIILFLLGRKRL